MSKIYAALRRHENRIAVPVVSAEQQPQRLRGPLAQALDGLYQIVYRMANEAGHGLVLQFVAASPGEGASTLSSPPAMAT
jgi:hypothetical protein